MGKGIEEHQHAHLRLQICYFLFASDRLRPREYTPAVKRRLETAGEFVEGDLVDLIIAACAEYWKVSFQILSSDPTVADDSPDIWHQIDPPDGPATETIKMAYLCPGPGAGTFSLLKPPQPTDTVKSP